MNSELNFTEAQRFSPERWVNNHKEAGQVHNSHAFMQFGAGPRVCPGKHLALLEIRMVLSMLTRNFALEFAGDPAEVHEMFSFTMMPSSLPMRLHPLA
jgi:cytochrome P450